MSLFLYLILTYFILEGISTTFSVPLKTGAANSARDAFAKSIYAKLFAYIVTRVNNSLPFSQSKAYIGVLDIAGFGK